MAPTKQPVFLLCANSLSDRGDSVALIELWRGLEAQGLSAVIVYQESNLNNSPGRLSEMAEQEIPVAPCETKHDVEKLAAETGVTHVVVFSDGTPSGIFWASQRGESVAISGTIHVTWAVFRVWKPHGDYYLYVSKWNFKANLVNRMRRRVLSLGAQSPQRTQVSYAPHFLEVQIGCGEEFRNLVGVPKEAKLIGRVGGRTEFSDPAAQSAVKKVLAAHENIWFVFASTDQFVRHPRAVFIDRLDRLELWNFYAACDLLLNGRLMGESFGLGIVEALRLDKPVLAPHPARNRRMDKNHVSLLRRHGLLYRSEDELVRKLVAVDSGCYRPGVLSKGVSFSYPSVGTRRFLAKLGLRNSH